MRTQILCQKYSDYLRNTFYNVLILHLARGSTNLKPFRKIQIINFLLLNGARNVFVLQ